MKKLLYLIIFSVALVSCNNDYDIIETNIQNYFKEKCVEYESIKTVVTDTVGITYFKELMNVKQDMINGNDSIIIDCNRQLETVNIEIENLVKKHNKDIIDEYAIIEYNGIKDRVILLKDGTEDESDMILKILKQDTILLKNKKDTIIGFMVYHRYLCNGEEKKDSLTLDGQYNIFEYQK